MRNDVITIRGARTHNLKNLDIVIPRNQLVVITGLSGSGKSSLAFDTLFAEGNRRYVESLSAYARQFLSMMDKADVDSIEGLSPAISIEQKTSSHNPRSTVGTVTEIYDYLRLLFSRVGTPHCPTHGIALEAKSIDQITSELFELVADETISIYVPLITNSKGSHSSMLDDLQKDGFTKVKVNGTIYSIHEIPPFNAKKKSTIHLLVDKTKVMQSKRKRIVDSLETAISKGNGVIEVEAENQVITFSTKHSCPKCDFSLTELEPRIFSFNSPMGACPNCDGLGYRNYADPDKIIVHPELTIGNGAIRGWNKNNQYSYSLLASLAKHYEFSLDKPIKKLSKATLDIIFNGNKRKRIPFNYIGSRGQTITRRHSFEGISKQIERRYRETESDDVRQDLIRYFSSADCPDCEGTRLKLSARKILIDGSSLPNIVSLTIKAALEAIAGIRLHGNREEIANPILNEITQRLTFLNNVGLHYLTLDRSSNTLSGGEAQRIRLASQIGAGLVGVMYVLDEPSIGLHQRDNYRLIETLRGLQTLGNTIIVVEHDMDTMLHSDHIIDLGPGAGKHGGHLIAQGTPKDIMKSKESITGDYLSGRKKISMPSKRIAIDKNNVLTIVEASTNNLKNITVSIPLGCFTCVTGVSGSGKSSLINATLYPTAAHHLNFDQSNPHTCKEILNLNKIDKIIKIDQDPIGRTPRSNPATYIGLFTFIRTLYSTTTEAKARGYNIGRFSFNVKGGRCEECRGDGLKKVEMSFMADMYVTCEICQGKRFNQETLEVTYRNKSIYDVLSMTVEDALLFFKNHPQIHNKLKTLNDVGLGYITLGQSSNTLSGGEAQRIKLSRELSKRNTGATLYLLDEPTVGLHFHDVAKLIELLVRLRNCGNTIVVIEHNLDVIKCADHIIDLGPDGGVGGGCIVAQGTPEEIAKNSESETGKFIKAIL